MSMRGLVVALLCGVLGLGIGVGVAYLAQPSASHGATATPITAVSPSLPIDETPTRAPYAPDITFPKLEPGLPLQAKHVISNQLARWSYHVPLGWQPYWVCSTASSCPAGAYTDKPMAPGAVNNAQEVRFRPPDEPKTGGYSLRVRILNNTFVDVHQTVGTKITGFHDSSQIAEFHILHKDKHSVRFEYRDKPSNLHRFNYFQWFAVPGQTNATLEMSVSGRSVDVPGLNALFNRFADNLVGMAVPTSPPTNQQQNSPSSPTASAS